MNTDLINQVEAAFREEVAKEIESMQPRASEQLTRAQRRILTLTGKLECSERLVREQRRQLQVEEIRRESIRRSLSRQIRTLQWSNDAHVKAAALSNSHDYGTPVVTESPTQYNKLWDEFIDMRDQRDRLAAASKAPW